MIPLDDIVEGSKLVSPRWLRLYGNDPRVRVFEVAGLGHEDRAEYLRGHVPGAVCWQWKDMLWDERDREFPAPEEFARRMAGQGIANDTTVVVYGEDVMFGSYAWWVLTYCGHADVRLLDGGRHGWIGAGEGLETGDRAVSSPQIYTPVVRREEMRIGRDEVRARLGTGCPILDARSPEEYFGERLAPPGFPDSGATRAGRIPGAAHLHYSDILDDRRRFRTPAEIGRLVDAAVGVPGHDAILYCRLSHRATMLHFALSQLLKRRNVRVYDGSWTEWGNLVNFPIER